MDIRAIKNDRNYFWTNHSKHKLLQYGLSPSVVKKVINRPERTEEGVAPETTAMMIRKDTKKMQREVWVMVQKIVGKRSSDAEKPEAQISTSRIKIISAWIYPGVSPKGHDFYVPDDVWEALGE